jgi:hypothetical protein
MMKLLKKEHMKMKRAKVYLPLFLVFLLIITMSIGAVAADKGNKSLPKTAIKGDWIVFDANNIATYIRNNGSFNRNPGSGNAGFEWIKGSGKTAIYASGLWLGAKVAGDIRTAAAEYSYEYGAGPVGASISDPQWKMYKIKRGDDATVSDYANWPYSSGAPALRNFNNTADSLDANGKHIPNLIGDMTVFCIFNDADVALHTMGKTQPLGMEVQLTAWAFNRSDALGNTIYYKWRFINKSGHSLDQTYVCIWCDADVGNNGGNDYDGCDTTLGLGYTYNGSTEPDYPNGCATGFDFLQGPIVPGAATDTAKLPDGRILPGKKILKMTSYLKYSNDQSDLGNPGTGIEIYNYFMGLTRSGKGIKAADSNATKFMYTGDPNNPNGAKNWIETDPPGDRRFMMTAGPFTMAANDTQDVVAGNAVASGASLAGSVTALKNADAAVQTAYDLNFNLAAPPPAPIVEVSSLANGIVLTWGKDEVTADIDESFHKLDPIAQAAQATNPYYDFQGYVVYQYENASGANPKIVKTFDIKDGVKIIYDNVFDASIGQYVNKPVKYGTDAGVFRSIRITKDAYTGTTLVNNKNYYFGVTAYAYNSSKESVPLTLESSARIQTARARLINMGDTFSSLGLDTLGTPNADANNRSTAAHTTGISNGFVIPVVVQPDSVTGDIYKIVFDNAGGVFHYSVFDSTRNTNILSSRADFADDESHPIKDGILWKVVDAPQAIKSASVTSGTPWVTGGGTYGFSYFGAGIDLGMIMGDVTVAYAPTLLFSQCKKVEVRIDASNPGKAYRFRRLANTAGPAGYRMTYQNMVNIPVQAWDVTDPANPKQLNVGFRDQVVDSVWNPWGNYTELLWICASAYDPTGATYATILGGPAESDLMYVLELAVLPGHVKYESANTITILPYYPLTANDVYRINTTNYKATPGKVDVAKTQIDRINAVPNPYFAANAYETNQFGHVMRITNLPAVAKIRIFNLAGQLIRTYDKNDPNLTSLDWDLNNANALPVASGMYIIHIDMGAIGTKVLKVAVIQAEERLNNL